MLYRKPVASILPPLSYRGAGHGGDRHPENGGGAVLFRSDGEWWLDLCRLAHTTEPPIAFQHGERFNGSSVYPDGSVFEWDKKAFEVMGHDRLGARLWVREVNADLDVPTTIERDPEVRQTVKRKDAA